MAPQRAGKSPARERPSTDEKPLAMRRTPRKTAPPSRLGEGDNWGLSPASKWVAKTEEKKPTPKPAQSAPSPPSAKTRRSKATLPGHLAALRAKAPKAFDSLEGAAFAFMGEVIATTLIKGAPLSAQRLVFFSLWGALVSSVVGPWLQLLASFQVSKASFTLDCMGKAVLNQLTMTPMLTTVFILLYSTAIGGVNPSSLANTSRLSSLIAMAFRERYAYTAAYWLSTDFFTLLAVPVNLQPRFAMLMGFVWNVLSSLLTA